MYLQAATIKQLCINSFVGVSECIRRVWSAFQDKDRQRRRECPCFSVHDRTFLERNWKGQCNSKAQCTQPGDRKALSRFVLWLCFILPHILLSGRQWSF